MKGKRTEWADWIRDYLKEQGADASSWEEYKVLYNRYAARIRKYHPENYNQFINLCTFSKLTKKNCGARDLGESKPKESPFNEAKYWKDQKRDFDAWKLRMKRYREDKIRNPQTNEEKDRMPYTFSLALKCLGGTYPIECFPKELEDYHEELQNILNGQKPEKVWN